MAAEPVPRRSSGNLLGDLSSLLKTPSPPSSPLVNGKSVRIREPDRRVSNSSSLDAAEHGMQRSR